MTQISRRGLFTGVAGATVAATLPLDRATAQTAPSPRVTAYTRKVGEAEVTVVALGHFPLVTTLDVRTADITAAEFSLALDAGFANVMMLPPFYYKNVSEEGLFQAFARAIEALNDARLRVIIYDFPLMTGLTISTALLARLRKAFDGIVVGVKNSSGAWPAMEEALTQLPGFKVFAGTEQFLLPTLRAGGPGCISATANVTIGALADIVARPDEADALQSEAARVRQRVGEHAAQRFHAACERHERIVRRLHEMRRRRTARRQVRVAQQAQFDSPCLRFLRDGLFRRARSGLRRARLHRRHIEMDRKQRQRVAHDVVQTPELRARPCDGPWFNVIATRHVLGIAELAHQSDQPATRGVHGGVGMALQGFGVGAVLGIHGDPNAGAKLNILAFDPVRLKQPFLQAIGHGLHGLLTTIRYPSFSGTYGGPDYVEFPAQVLEHWAGEPQVLAEYARHYQTGEVIPQALIDKMNKASTFNQGFKTTEFIAASLIDLHWHMLTSEEAAKVSDARAFELEVLKKYNIPEVIEPRYRSTYFSHIFDGGYSAGYYSYLWAEILDADGFDAFKQSGDIYNPELAAKLKQWVYESGGLRETDELYRNFRGSDPGIEPLLRNRGFADPAPAEG